MGTRKKKYKKKPDLVKIKGNDLIFYFIKNQTLQINCYIKNGFIYENRNNIGISHFLEHLITNAWKKCNFKQCSIYWNEKGVYYNAHTNLSSVIYTIHGIDKFNSDMLDYMTSIVNNPKIILSNFEIEREAVRSELLSYLNKREHLIADSFNKNFYTVEGLKLSNDYRAQLKNLDKFTRSDMIDWYEKYYNRFLFSFYGDFDKRRIVNYLKNKLICGENKIPQLNNSCFSYKNTIIYNQDKDSKQTIIKIGFPSKIRIGEKDYILIDTVCKIIKRLLFLELRTKLKLIYGISVSSVSNECGNYSIINVNSNNENVIQVLINIIKLLNFYSKNTISGKFVDGSLSSFLYNLNNLNFSGNKDISNFYNRQYFNQFFLTGEKIYTPEDMIIAIAGLNVRKLQVLIKKIFNTETCLICYQSNKKLI